MYSKKIGNENTVSEFTEAKHTTELTKIFLSRSSWGWRKCNKRDTASRLHGLKALRLPAKQDGRKLYARIDGVRRQ